MGWFRKKPSVQEMKADLGLITGDPVPFQRYALVLRTALMNAADYRQPGEIAGQMGLGKSITPEQGAAILDGVMYDFSAVYGALQRLRDMRPDIPHLLDVHVAAVSYLEQFMMAADRENVTLRLDLQGETQEASRLHDEAKRRDTEVVKTRDLLAAELGQLNRRDRALYASLEIPHESLIRLGLT
jgi:hypothetical protein